MKKEYKEIAELLLDESKDLNQFIVDMEKAIAKLQPYKHELNNVLEACNISFSSIKEPDLMEIEGPKSLAIEKIEEIFTKRQLALMFFSVSEEQMKLGSKIPEKSKERLKEVIKAKLMTEYGIDLSLLDESAQLDKSAQRDIASELRKAMGEIGKSEASDPLAQFITQLSELKSKLKS